MKIVEQRLLRGPNIHSPRPAFQAIVDLEDLDDVSSAAIAGFAERLVALIPSLDEHRCSTGHRGGFVERLHEGTYMAHIAEHVLIELQCLAGPELGFGKARMVKGRPRHYRIVTSYVVEPLVLAAFPLALEIVERLAKGQEVPDFETRLDALRDLADDDALGPSTRAVVEAAQARNIPALRLAEGTGFFQLGWGARAQRIRATITGRTSHVAVDVASDKQLTKELLGQAAIPVPRGSTVRTPEALLDAMRRIGRPVTIKPLDANQGKGVTVDVRDEASALAAFARAQEWGRRVIVEESIRGEDHRVLVVAGRVVAASRRRPPQVAGDGVHTVAELVAGENRNPLRGSGHLSPLTRIRLDAAALELLAMQGLAPESIVPAGTLVLLRGNANLSTGGTAEDVTDRLHPDTAHACERAARAVGLDVAGVDLVCEDIGRGLGEQRGAIIEVNAAPGIRMHEFPSSGVARRAGAAIVDSLFRPGEDGRIPVIAVTGTNGKTTTTLAIGSVMRAAGYHTGVTTTEGVYIDERQVKQGDCSGYWSARMVLTSPEVEAAVLETARGGILKRGLAFDHCDVGVVLNVQADHLGQDGVDTVEDLARVKGLVARRARRAAVLNADDPLCRRMAHDLAPATEVVYFSMLADNPALVRHLATGGRAVYLRGNAIVLAEGERRTPLVDAQRLPFTLNGLARHNVANALACAAAAWALGVLREHICAGLVSFRSAASVNPLRLNLYRARGTTVLVDYAHNPAAYRAMAVTARQLVSGRIVALVAAPGDRRDTELEDVGRACAGAFEHVIVYEMDDRRGRARGETARIIAAAALAAGVAPDALQVVPDRREAVRTGAGLCGAEDLLLYGCASYVSDVADAIPEGVEELAVVERRRAHLAPYADGYSIDMPSRSALPAGWDPSRPDRRRAPTRPYLVRAAA
ncbi:MAG TPA: cyanophycin synthetase [Gemmatimonadaceae bacterium]|nr:cyanophycin synthetase [Gemmatimonadaceae bacterium]